MGGAQGFILAASGRLAALRAATGLLRASLRSGPASGGDCFAPSGSLARGTSPSMAWPFISRSPRAHHHRHARAGGHPSGAPVRAAELGGASAGRECSTSRPPVPATLGEGSQTVPPAAAHSRAHSQPENVALTLPQRSTADSTSGRKDQKENRRRGGHPRRRRQYWRKPATPNPR